MLLADDGAVQTARILLGKESLRDLDVEINGDAQRESDDGEQDGAEIIEHDFERRRIGGNDPLVKLFRGVV